MGAGAALWIGIRRDSGAAEEELIGCDAELQQIVQSELECQDAAVAFGIQKGILHGPPLVGFCGAGQAKGFSQSSAMLHSWISFPELISISSANTKSLLRR